MDAETFSSVRHVAAILMDGRPDIDTTFGARLGLREVATIIQCETGIGEAVKLLRKLQDELDEVAASDLGVPDFTEWCATGRGAHFRTRIRNLLAYIDKGGGARQYQNDERPETPGTTASQSVAISDLRNDAVAREGGQEWPR